MFYIMYIHIFIIISVNDQKEKRINIKMNCVFYFL